MKGSLDTAITLAAFPKWTVTNLTYSFYTTLPAYYNGVHIPTPTAAGNPFYLAVFDSAGLNAAEQGVVVGGLTGVSTFTPLTFTSAGNSHTSTLGFGAYDVSQGTPGVSGYTQQGNSGTDFAGDVWLTPSGRLPTPAGQNPSFGYHVAVHEIGHALGLRHPYEATASNLPVLTGIEDSESFTIMSTVAPVGSPSSARVVYEFQLYDIAALQLLYGPHTAYRPLSDGYGWFNFVQDVPAGGPGDLQNRYFCIWDAGGTDIIDAKADESVPTLAGSAYIDLRPGYFSSLGMNTGVTFLDSRLATHGIQNVSIAFGAYIENARGTVHSDALVGNNFTNSLDGDAGADLIFGSGAAIAWANAHAAELGFAGDCGLTDTDAGDYRTITQAGIGSEADPDETASTDQLIGGGGNDILVAGTGNTFLSGGDDDDKLMGGAGADTLDGGAGNDTFWGMGGLDTVDYSESPSRVAITIVGEGATASISVLDGFGGTDTLHSIDTIVATTGLDVFRFSGVLDTGYALTLDAQGGQSQHDMLNFQQMGTGFDLQIIPTGGILTSRPGPGHTGGGTVTLLNFNTQILGSAFDDTIADSSSGRKTIDGGDGNDIITVGGDARAMLSGGGGDDVLTGGDGSDLLIDRDGDNQLFGGAGTDLLISDRLSYSVEADLLDGGAGSDLLIARGTSDNVILRGGGGNDLIDAREGGNVILHFGANDGNDTLEGEGFAGTPTLATFSDNWSLGIADIVFTGLDLDDVTIRWDLTIADEVYDAGAQRWDYIGIGDLAIIVNATGASIFFKNVANSFSTFGHHDPINLTTSYSAFGLPRLLFDDGQFEAGESAPNIDIVIGAVGQYELARADYAEGVEESIVDEVGTSGGDELSGGIGDDSLAGGDGDDSFRASGGEDLFDGGAGGDTLYLFGARLDFVITRDAATGDVAFADQAGTEGTITVKSVEKIYFATDNAEHDIGDLVGFWGTPGDDSLVEGNARDNLIYGLAGADLLRGLAGNDLLIGGAGDDVMEGGAGNDTYFVESAADLAIEGAGAGYDAVYTSLSYALAAGAEVEWLSASAVYGTGAINLTGNEFGNTILGNEGVNVLNGAGGADALVGYGGSDVYYVDNAGDVIIEAGGGFDAVYTGISYALTVGAEVEWLSTDATYGTGAINLTGNDFGNYVLGNDGANVLDGGAGADIIAGYGGADMFAFTTALGGGNVDSIVDMAAGTDKIGLDDAIFTAAGGLGALNASAFVVGSGAADAGDRIIYNSATGQLFYDSDGIGGAAQILFATLNASPALTASDFAVI
jgi:Ca2+-binding RTX toxin-like protein